MLTIFCYQELYAKLNRIATIASDIFVGRERFATLLTMRLTETVILWLSEDQSFWEEIEEGQRPLGPLGLQQVLKSLCSHWPIGNHFFFFDLYCFFSFSLLQFYLDMQFVILFGQGRFLSRHVHQVIIDVIERVMAAFSATGMNPDRYFLPTIAQMLFV